MLKIRKTLILKGNNNYDKSTIHLPRQECGVQGISWHSADTLGHSFPAVEGETTIRLRMRNGKTTVLQQSLNCAGVSLEGSAGKGVIVEKYVIVIEFEMRSEAILLRLF